MKQRDIVSAGYSYKGPTAYLSDEKASADI